MLGWLNLFYSLSGLLVGVLVGFTGVGGGSLMTPLMVLLFGIAPATAVGTDLLYASITKMGGALVHGWNGTVDWRIVRRLASGSLPATLGTLAGLAWFGRDSHGTSHVITASLGVALVLTAISITFRRVILERLAATIDRLDERQIMRRTVLLGAAVGFLVSISSVGAGAIGGTVLLLLYPRLPVARIVGSDIVHAIPVTLIAGIGHVFIGDVNWSLLGSLLVGSLPGIAIGSHFAARVPDRVLRPLMAGTLAVVGAKLWF